MAIGLIDVDGKLPNLALMKISSYYKSLGEQVEFVRPGKKYEKIYASAIFERSKKKCEELLSYYGDIIEIGGTGWCLEKNLPDEIEKMKPDYDLYTVEYIASRIKGIGKSSTKLMKAQVISDAGMGYTCRGCIRNCGFCVVPKKEGKLRQVNEIKDLLNPRSNVLILHDNNLTADPHCLEKLREIKERNLIVDINQGCDIRLMTEDIAKALSEVRHLRSVHYAWDLMAHEKQVIEGINLLSKYIKRYKHMCYILVGYNTTFEEDVYRFRKLRELQIKPYVMVYNEKKDTRLNHFARWVNGRIYTTCTFEEYEPWVKAQQKENQLLLIV